MNREWNDDRPQYECRKCGRVVYAHKDGYMPTHRKPRRRAWCDGSGASVKFHKKVTT